MTDEDHPILADLALTPVEADPDRVVDLVAEGERLLDRARERGTGRAVRAVVRQPGQHVILLAIPAGGCLPDHDAPGPASLMCLSGAVVLRSGESSWRLTPATACAIPQARHEVHAAVDSVCVLVISMR